NYALARFHNYAISLRLASAPESSKTSRAPGISIATTHLPDASVLYMKRVATAAVLIPLVLLATLRAPNWIFAFLVGLVALLATDEYLGLAQGFGAFPFRRSTFALVVLCFALLSGAAYLMDRKNYSVS